ncbi:MAG: FAD-dependent oxidoreductase [Rickettsiales bacterium]|nr:FAD-dependent oxidoreductase [Rickettsiales bacterium]
MKIAIIGSGISGLGAAYLLHQEHDITLYEKNNYLGGHSRTIEAQTADGPIPVDTGFIVFNYRNYPNLTGLFKQIDVPVAISDMSFAASIDDGWMEYGTQSLSNVFAQKRNLLRPQFWRMIRDTFTFNKRAMTYLNKDPSISLGQCLDELGMGEWFRNYFILAMGGAIWSTPLQQMLAFPAQTFVRFFDNHGLLTVNDQPQWYTVKGGSREYVKRVSEPFKDRIQLGCGVQRVTRTADGVEVSDERGDVQHYDQVIFACHSDQAMALLETPSKEERITVGNVRYQPNRLLLHSDVRLMPKRKQAWASWVYMLEGRTDSNPAVSLSYWMNRLQPLETEIPLIVTLNPGIEPDPELVYDEHVFEHPVFDADAIRAQNKLDNIQGKDRIWYCGAWQRYGFHEDGLLSAVRVVEKMGGTIPWK